MIMMMMMMIVGEEEESHLLRKPNEGPCKLRCRDFPSMPISQCHDDDDDDDGCDYDEYDDCCDDDGRDDYGHTYGHDTDNIDHDKKRSIDYASNFFSRHSYPWHSIR